MTRQPHFCTNLRARDRIDAADCAPSSSMNIGIPVRVLAASISGAKSPTLPIFMSAPDVPETDAIRRIDISSAVISRENTPTGIPDIAIFNAHVIIRAVLPMPGLPAMIYSSPPCRPPVCRSNCLIPVSMPVIPLFSVAASMRFSSSGMYSPTFRASLRVT